MRRGMVLLSLLVAVLVMVVLTGCGKKEELGPEEVVQEFFMVVGEGDYEKAGDYYFSKELFLEGTSTSRPVKNDLADMFPKGSIKGVETYAFENVSPNLARMNVLLSYEFEGKPMKLAKLGVEVTKAKKDWLVYNPDIADDWQDPDALCAENINAIVDLMNQTDIAEGKGKKTATKNIFLAPESIKGIMDNCGVSYWRMCCPLTGEEFILTKAGEHEFALASPRPEAYGLKNEYAFHIHPEYLPGEYGGVKGKYLQWVIYKVLTDGAENLAMKESMTGGDKLTVVADMGINLRSGAGINYSIVKKLAQNDKVIPLGEEEYAEGGKWLLVRTLDGYEGWVCTGISGEVWVE